MLESLQQYVPAAAALAVFVTTIAYLHHPRAKALVYSLPVPFTCGYLATRMPINATHLTGLMLVIGYNWLVYLLHRRAKLQLVYAVPVSALSYVALAAAVRPLRTVSPLWIAALFVALWLLHVATYRPAHEPGGRSTTPWWLKMPIVFGVGLVMYASTSTLLGAVTTFPYAGVFTSFEMRQSLRTLAAQFTINAVGIILMMVTIWALEPRWPGPWPLLAGWGVLLLTVTMIYRLGLGRAATVATDD